MADDPTPTPNSEPTPTPNPTSDPAPDPVAVDPAADPAPKGDDLGATALGGDPDPQADPNADPASDPEPKGEIPEAYELTAPEGFEITPESVEAATPVFKELGLTNDQANKLMPVAADFAKKLVENRDQQFMGEILKQRADWLAEAKEDKEIGGANFDANLQVAAKALDTLGFPKGSPLRVALDESGFGNNPELIRLMVKVGKAVGEDSDFVRSDANAAVKEKTAEQVLWPKSGS